MKFIIDRRFWSRGPRSDGMLLQSAKDHHNRCCLGIIAQQCGIEDVLLDTVPVPHAIEPGVERQKFQQFADPFSRLVQEMVDINDSIDDDATIEAELKAIVSKYTNHELEFIN